MSKMALIPEFYAGKSVFITGSTGFMGKILIERLLSTCPEIGKLYLLMRSKKDVTPEKRLLQLKHSEVFHIIRQKCPFQLKKLVLIPGDTSMPGLGIEPEYLVLMQEVSIVFHSAASLRFDEPLKVAMKQNFNSTVLLLGLCDKLPKMQAFVYVSTAYSNADLHVIEEKVYQPPKSIQDVFKTLEKVPDNVLNDMTEEYIFPKPNTYTFSKALAEYAVAERWSKQYPVAIFRPTIVISSYMHPFPGWIENLNGPSGFTVGYGKGLLHVMRANLNARADLMPVDMVIDTMIAVAWEIGTEIPSAVKVYNCSSIENPTTWGHFKNSTCKYLEETPFNDTLWYPCVIIVKNQYFYTILEFILQTLPFHLMQYGSLVLGVKTKMNFITASKRLQNMNSVLEYFSTREWTFRNDNVRKLRENISHEDRRIFNIDIRKLRWENQYENFVKGTKKYYLKESNNHLKEAKQHLKRLKYIHYCMFLVVFVVIYKMLF